MIQSTYSIWKSVNPEVVNSIIFRKKDGPEDWGIVLSKWKQYTHSQKGVSKHLYAPVINLKTGDVFLQQDRSEVLLKFALQILGRPIHIALKTIFHALIPFSIPLQILITIQNSCLKNVQGEKNQTKTQILNECLKNSFRSFADIIRTPLYGIALIVHSLAALVIIPFNRNRAYKLMEKSGEIEKALNWGETHRIGTLFNCFQPYFNISEIDRIWQGELADTKYTFTPSLQYNKTLRGLTNFARAQIHELQKSEEIPKGARYKGINKSKLVKLNLDQQA